MIAITRRGTATPRDCRLPTPDHGPVAAASANAGPPGRRSDAAGESFRQRGVSKPLEMVGRQGLDPWTRATRLPPIAPDTSVVSRLLRIGRHRDRPAFNATQINARRSARFQALALRSPGRDAFETISTTPARVAPDGLPPVSDPLCSADGDQAWAGCRSSLPRRRLSVGRDLIVLPARCSARRRS